MVFDCGSYDHTSNPLEVTVFSIIDVITVELAATMATDLSTEEGATSNTTAAVTDTKREATRVAEDTCSGLFTTLRRMPLDVTNSAESD